VILSFVGLSVMMSLSSSSSFFIKYHCICDSCVALSSVVGAHVSFSYFSTFAVYFSTSFILSCFTILAVRLITLSFSYTGFAISGEATTFAATPPFPDFVSTFAAFRCIPL
jgi:hypothetical protein